MSDAETMALCAIRYTIGRRSYIVSDGQRWAREWGVRCAWIRGILIRDLQEEVRRCDEGLTTLGGPPDENGWRQVLADLQDLATRERRDE